MYALGMVLRSPVRRTAAGAQEDAPFELLKLPPYIRSRLIPFRNSSPPCVRFPKADVCCGVTEWGKPSTQFTCGMQAVSTTPSTAYGCGIRFYLHHSSCLLRYLWLLLILIHAFRGSSLVRSTVSAQLFFEESSASVSHESHRYDKSPQKPSTLTSQHEDQTISRHCGGDGRGSPRTGRLSAKLQRKLQRKFQRKSQLKREFNLDEHFRHAFRGSVHLIHDCYLQ